MLEFVISPHSKWRAESSVASRSDSGAPSLTQNSVESVKESSEEPREEKEANEGLEVLKYKCPECGESFSDRLRSHLHRTHAYNKSDAKRGWKRVQIVRILGYRVCPATQEKYYLCEANGWDERREIPKERMANPTIVGDYHKEIAEENKRREQRLQKNIQRMRLHQKLAKKGKQVKRKRKRRVTVGDGYDEEKSIESFDTGTVESLLSFSVGSRGLVYAFRVRFWVDGPPVYKIVPASSQLVRGRPDLLSHLVAFYARREEKQDDESCANEKEEDTTVLMEVAEEEGPEWTLEVVPHSDALLPTDYDNISCRPPYGTFWHQWPTTVEIPVDEVPLVHSEEDPNEPQPPDSHVPEKEPQNENEAPAKKPPTPSPNCSVM